LQMPSKIVSLNKLSVDQSLKARTEIIHKSLLMTSVWA
jgi:hypothetical protein